jgi:hypothetical protein
MQPPPYQPSKFLISIRVFLKVISTSPCLWDSLDPQSKEVFIKSDHEMLKLGI